LLANVVILRHTLRLDLANIAGSVIGAIFVFSVVLVDHDSPSIYFWALFFVVIPFSVAGLKYGLRISLLFVSAVLFVAIITANSMTNNNIDGLFFARLLGTLLGLLFIAYFYEYYRHEAYTSLNLEFSERKQAEAKLEHMATHDPLTGVYNRQVLEQQLSDEINRANRYNHTLSIFMLDIDYFKPVNDTYGHQAGDTVLRSFAEVVGNSIRNTDFLARYGGEEFVVILPETPFTEAIELAERLCNLIAEHSCPIADHKELNITASIGVAAFPDYAKSWQDLLNVADNTMYAAKKAGRNQVKTPRTITQNENV